MTSFKEFLLEISNPDYLNFKGAQDKKALKKEMMREINKFKDKDHKDKDAYPDDWTADKKYKKQLKDKNISIPPSKYTVKYKQMYGEEEVSESAVDTALKNKSEKTKIPVSFLRRVYDKGLAAWRTGHRPGISQHQWAMARVNSFIVGGPARKADKEIWDAYMKSMKEESSITEKWNDSGATDANGRWAKYRDGKIGVDAMATWLYNSRVHKRGKAEKLKSAYGAISQQQNTSKLISSDKADSLRAALKRKYGEE